MPTPRLLRALAAAALLAACGSSRPTDSTASNAEPRTEPADAGVSLGRPSEPGDAGTPELPPTVVKSEVLEAHRLTGDRAIPPDPADQAALSGKTTAIKVCVDAAGKVSAVKFLRSSGRPGYDDKIERTVRTWTFRPIVVENQPVEVCAVMVFAFRPSPPPP